MKKISADPKKIIEYVVLYLIFVTVNLGFFPYYNKIMIFVKGELSDYYIAVLLQGFIKGDFLTEHAGTIYNAVIFIIMFLAGAALLYMLSVFRLSYNRSMLIVFFCMFCGFSLTTAFTHPDIIVLMMILPVILCCIFDTANYIKKREGRAYLLTAIIAAACLLPVSSILLRRVFTGNAPGYILGVLQRTDKEEIMYLFVVLLIFAGFIAVSVKRGTEGKGWLYTGMTILLIHSYLIAYNEYSAFKNFLTDTDYISYVNVKGSMDGIKEGLPGGAGILYIPAGIIICIIYIVVREYISGKEKTGKQS